MAFPLALLLFVVNLIGVRSKEALPSFPQPSLPSYPALSGYPFPNPSPATPFRPTMQHRTYYVLPSPVNANSIRYKTGPATVKYEAPRLTSTTTTVATTTTGNLINLGNVVILTQHSPVMNFSCPSAECGRTRCFSIQGDF